MNSVHNPAALKKKIFGDSYLIPVDALVQCEIGVSGPHSFPSSGKDYWVTRAKIKLTINHTHVPSGLQFTENLGSISTSSKKISRKPPPNVIKRHEFFLEALQGLQDQIINDYIEGEVGLEVAAKYLFVLLKKQRIILASY